MSVLAWEENVAAVPAVALGLRESNVASVERGCSGAAPGQRG